MRYRVSVHFTNGRTEVYEADGYTTSNCVLQLYTHTPQPNSKVRIFPLVDIQEITMEDKSA